MFHQIIFYHAHMFPLGVTVILQTHEDMDHPQKKKILCLVLHGREGTDKILCDPRQVRCFI